MSRKKLVVPLLLLAAVMTGVILTVAIRGGAAAPAAPPPPHVGTATVVRTNLATTVLTAGTLGYAPAGPLINQLTGTYTSLPAIGRTIRRGHVLYRVDNQPVVLMIGRTPAWRQFGLGMTSGPDVGELQANLIRLGYATGLLSAPTGQFDVATADAVQSWQAAVGYPVTGQIAVGQVVFLPTPVLVGARNVAIDQNALPGDQPYQVSTDQRVIIVPVDPTLPPISVGEHVEIVMPSQSSTPGRVTAIGPAPPSGSNSGSGGSGSGSGGSGSGGPGSGSSSTTATTVLTVTPDRPHATGTGSGVPVQISLTIQSVQHVLAVPVSALLALAGGGYGLELMTPSGAHRLIGVTTGIFAGGMVQVSGSGLAPGVKVVVAQ